MLSKKKLRGNLMLLICLVMMSLNAFSQTATDSTKIQLTKPIAKLVIKDLIQFDGLSTEMQTMQSILTETNNKLLTQNQLVTNLQLQNNNLESVIRELNAKYDTQARLTLDFEKALKRQKRQSTIYKIGTTVGAAAVLLLLVQ
jgi:predicted nucleotide-binding protein (sugar kinase/HSP70/actin superfamily)